MKEFEGASFKQRVAQALTFIGWRCINISYRMMGMGIELDEDQNDFITRVTGRTSETEPKWNETQDREITWRRLRP